MKEPILVKLKMKPIYKNSLSFIGLLILAALTIGILYLFYDKVIDNDGDIEANGVLTINYIDGSKKFNIQENANFLLVMKVKIPSIII